MEGTCGCGCVASLLLAFFAAEARCKCLKTAQELNYKLQEKNYKLNPRLTRWSMSASSSRLVRSGVYADKISLSSFHEHVACFVKGSNSTLGRRTAWLRP